jgi:hypothetical protein
MTKKKADKKADKIKVRGLTRGEIKGLKKYGYRFTRWVPVDDAEALDEAMEKAFSLVLSDAELSKLDAMQNRDVTGVWYEILKETYGRPEEVKNS